MQSKELREALAAEVVRLEAQVARAGSVLGCVGLVISAWMWLGRARPDVGVRGGLTSAFMLAWFQLAQSLLARGKGLRLIPVVGPFVESCVATGVMLGALATGADSFAAGNMTLQVCAVLVVIASIRGPWTPIAVSVWLAAQYALFYRFFVMPDVSTEMQRFVSTQPEQMLILRPGMLVLLGVIASLVRTGLGRAMFRATSEVRSRELFGKYRMGEKIASGGMGVVQRATYCPEGGFERPVALKLIHPHLAEQVERVDAFRREAELSARLLHPNIVQVLDFGRVDNTYFLAMEFVEGATLSQCLAHLARHGSAFSDGAAARIGREIAAALHFAHHVAADGNGRRLGVIHRDLNPPNVLVSRSGQVKVTDFGVAKVLHDATATHTSSVVGKTSYMAPEQAMGEGFDHRIDLFALGVMVWECLCARPLFRRDNDMATALAVVRDEIPMPWHVHPGVRAEIWRPFFARALQRNPAERFQSAAEMQQSLDAIVELCGAGAAAEVSSVVEQAILSRGPSPLSEDQPTRPIEARA